MFRPTQRHWIATTMFAIAASATACSAPDSEIADTATSEHELSGSEVPCGEFLAADIDVIGATGARIVSPATYGAVGASVCAKAYRVNVYDYSAATFNAGTVIGYGGAMPTTKADCEATDVRAYVWRRIATRGTDTATVFEDGKIVRGRWYVALDGTMSPRRSGPSSSRRPRARSTRSSPRSSRSATCSRAPSSAASSRSI